MNSSAHQRIPERSGAWIVRRSDAGRSELAAYRLAQRYFASVVPLTIPYLADGVSGSKQRHEGPTAYEYGSQIIPRTRTIPALRDLANIVGLDLVTGETDRHPDNWIVGADHLYAIDNGVPGGTQTLRSALRPVYFADLIDDPPYTLLLITELLAVLQVIHDHQLAPAQSLVAWHADLRQWLTDLAADAQRTSLTEVLDAAVRG